jgi:hypothetical protein
MIQSITNQAQLICQLKQPQKQGSLSSGTETPTLNPPKQRGVAIATAMELLTPTNSHGRNASRHAF